MRYMYTIHMPINTMENHEYTYNLLIDRVIMSRDTTASFFNFSPHFLGTRHGMGLQILGTCMPHIGLYNVYLRLSQI